MRLRAYKKEDSETIRQILMDEGTRPFQMRYMDGGYDTFVMEDEAGEIAGFFTITPLRGVFFLQHFGLNEGYRDLKSWRALEKFMRAVLLTKGSPIIIMGIPKANKRMNWLVEHAYGKKPYEINDASCFYSIEVVEVNHVR